jgi:hypothetical protein
MKARTRKLLSITGAVVVSFGATTAAATGNLMAEPDPPPAKKDTADAGTPVKKEAPKKEKK